MTENTPEPKKWAKPNIDPETAHIIKKIAVDEKMYIYQLIDKVFREKYPEYFKDIKAIKKANRTKTKQKLCFE